MAAKKDFSGANTGRVYGAIADATAPETQEEPERKERRTYNSTEARAAMMDMATQGRKGLKLSRINMAFSPDAITYIRVMSKIRGVTLTEFVNDIVLQSLEQNRETFEKAMELVRDFQSL